MSYFIWGLDVVAKIASVLFWLFLIFGFLEVFAAIIRNGTHYFPRFNWQYKYHFIDWHWSITNNDIDDPEDYHLYPRKVRDHGVSCEPFGFRFQFRKREPIPGSKSSGPLYGSAEERDRALKVEIKERIDDSTS